MKINRVFACLFLVVLLSAMAFAKEDSFVLNDEYGQNLYLSNNNVEINSNLYGDLFTVTDILEVNALVQDDINAVAGKFTLAGTVGSDLRIVSSMIKIDGTVFGETMIAGNSVFLSDKSAFGRDVNIHANYVEINGTIQGDLKVNADKVILNGVVEGNAIIDSAIFELGPQARIIGDLTSSKDIDEVSSQVGGTVSRTEGRESKDSFTSMTFRKIGLFLSIFLIGAVLVLLSGKYTEKTAKIVSSRFFISLILGFGILIAVPIAAIFIAVTIVGLPLSILLGLIYLTLIILAFGMSAILVGKSLIRLFKGAKAIWIELLIGALALALLSIVPAIFWALMIVLLLTSMGAFVLVFFKKDTRR